MVMKAGIQPINRFINEIEGCGDGVDKGGPVWRLQPILIEQHKRHASEHGPCFHEPVRSPLMIFATSAGLLRGGGPGAGSPMLSVATVLPL